MMGARSQTLPSSLRKPTNKAVPNRSGAVGAKGGARGNHVTCAGARTGCRVFARPTLGCDGQNANVAAPRTRSSACDMVARFCAQSVLCCFASPPAPTFAPPAPLRLGPLCSSVSPATLAESRLLAIIGHGYSLRAQAADIPTSQHGFAIDLSTKASQTSCEGGANKLVQKTKHTRDD